MGRSGIRRRKRRRPLPPVPDVPVDDTPPVMWSPPGSGFEASPLSPAGRSQALWRATLGWNRLSPRRQRAVRRRLLRLYALGVALVVASMALVAALQWLL